jgi:hypothetical protein
VTVVSAPVVRVGGARGDLQDPSGTLADELLYRHDEPRLEVAAEGRPWSFDGDGISSA